MDAVRSLPRMACQDASAGHMGSTLRGDTGPLNSLSGSVVLPIPISLPRSVGRSSRPWSLVRRIVWPRQMLKDRPKKRWRCR
jgi:hypothetical protein